MADAAIRFDDREWQAFFNQFKKGFDWANILKAAFSTAGFADIQQHFRDEKDESGAWKARKQSTVDRYTKIFNGQWKAPSGATKAQFNPSNKLLQQTGKLRGSILPANIVKKSANSIMVFSNLDYSGAHDRGTKTIPKRSFMWLSNSAKSRMIEIIMNLAIK
jgi:phage gpG-like protein